METVITIFIIAIILVLAISYIYNAKKRGQKCIGCPYAKDCSGGKCSCDR